MSDERSAGPSGADESAATDDRGSGDGDALEPSGGPQRVVSDESVDDILESLNDAKSEPEPEPTDSTDATATTTGSTEPVTTETEPAETAATAVDESEQTADEGADIGADDGAAADEAAAIDAAASSLPEDASVDELAARIEDGTVTGADVRAAEAGEGRESTPEIDDVDLSLDDLETTQSGGASGRDGLSDDAGPLAGSIDRDAATDGTDEDGDASPGLLGRLKRFFSR
ncbi:hypothetical protein [Natrinema salaciae]|uniref:Uncharacterized protein n=1 Tax=Natrinema salaciae TaxID=1186196 RepID=A0A1H8ZL75_9EURY|nr:hypothetical protein [Natrinema salaciae]SEP65269.1 hypothetical protein SAMN04489841_0205 [Natrinema salaciae]